MPVDRVHLNKKDAKALDRVREIIGLSIKDLVERAGVSEGSVRTFFKGGVAMREDSARPVHRQLRDVAQEWWEKHPGKLAEFVHKVIDETPLASINAARAQGREEWKLYSRAAQHLAETVMALTDATRTNLTKDFRYASDRHFRAHARCVRQDVRYYWLAYETSDPTDLKQQWQDYQRRLLANGVTSLSSVQCAVYPKAAQQSGRRIPFRITVFAKTKLPADNSPTVAMPVCLLTEEPYPRTYQLGQTIILRGPMLSIVQTALEKLYIACPSIETLGTPAYDKEVEKKLASRSGSPIDLHDELRAQVLRACLTNRLVGEGTLPYSPLDKATQ